jgi:hypothetical protein
MKKGFKTYTNSIPPADDVTANNKEAITLGELLAEYDLGVLKRWAEEQHVADAKHRKYQKNATNQPIIYRFNQGERRCLET